MELGTTTSTPDLQVQEQIERMQSGLSKQCQGLEQQIRKGQRQQRKAATLTEGHVNTRCKNKLGSAAWHMLQGRLP